MGSSEWKARLVVGLVLGLFFTEESAPGAERFAPLTSGTLGAARSPRAVQPPDSYALSVDGDVDLGGFVFKEGYPFLHNDGGASMSNTALGKNALVSLTPGVPDASAARGNTALGSSALRNNTAGSGNTAAGVAALYSNTEGEDNSAFGTSALGSNSSGSFNTASGVEALERNSEGERNTASGHRALAFNTTGNWNSAVGADALGGNIYGSYNVAAGVSALTSNYTGNRNVALGAYSGVLNSSGSDSVWIASYGVNESNTLRIGNGTGTGYFQQNRAFISGIRGIMPGPDALTVRIDGDGQLGTAASTRRVKEEISDMGAASSGLHELRPVTFRYRESFAGVDQPIRYGLIAEEVAEIFPELVAYDQEGQPAAVLDHLLTSMLLNEVQKQRREIEELKARNRSLEQLQARLEQLETAARIGG